MYEVYLSTLLIGWMGVLIIGANNMKYSGVRVAGCMVVRVKKGRYSERDPAILTTRKMCLNAAAVPLGRL